jgi:hypothetical protein
MEPVDICIEYKSQTRCYPCRLIKFGYSYRIVVTIDNTEVIYEPDEEGNFRARIEGSAGHEHQLKELIALVGNELQQLK